MILPLILIILIAGALIAAVSSKLHPKLPFYISLAALVGIFVGLLSFWNLSISSGIVGSTGKWILDYSCDWIKAIGAQIHLSMDGLSYIMLLLSMFMGIISVLVSSKVERQGFYFFNLLLMMAGVVGIFLAMDLLLFFFFWEMILVPLYLLLAAYNTQENNKAAFKFLLYTQVSGLIMLFSILVLYFIVGANMNIYSFDFSHLSYLNLPLKFTFLLMLGFVVAFFVKLPVVPVHGWMPATFQAAPAAAILTGLLIKTGAYGIMRFAIPLFPDASLYFAPVAIILGLITIFYGAFIAFSQNDLRLIAAYSSISHMGFIIIGLYVLNPMAWHGVVIQMIASGISTSALIIMAEWLRRNTGTCDISKLGQMWSASPVFSGFGLFFAMAALGLPGLANFIAEFLILAGTFSVGKLVAVIAALGVVAAAAYSLRIIQKVYVGTRNYNGAVPDVNWLEKSTLAFLVIVLLWIGFNPKPIMSRVQPAIEKVLSVPPSDIIPAQKNIDDASV